MAAIFIPKLLPGLFTWYERRAIDGIRHDRAAMEAFIADWEARCEARIKEHVAPGLHWRHPVWRPAWLTDWDGASLLWHLAAPELVHAYAPSLRARLDAVLRARFVRGEEWPEALKWSTRAHRDELGQYTDAFDRMAWGLRDECRDLRTRADVERAAGRQIDTVDDLLRFFRDCIERSERRALQWAGLEAFETPVAEDPSGEAGQ